jgi:hypothetical protein
LVLRSVAHNLHLTKLESLLLTKKYFQAADCFALETSMHVLSLAIAVDPAIAIVVVNFPDGMTNDKKAVASESE